MRLSGLPRAEKEYCGAASSTISSIRMRGASGTMENSILGGKNPYKRMRRHNQKRWLGRERKWGKGNTLCSVEGEEDSFVMVSILDLKG